MKASRLWLLAPTLTALIALFLAAPWASADNGFSPSMTAAGIIATNTTATVVSGQTYAILPTDIVRLDTSNSADAGGLKVILPSSPGNQQLVTTCWIAWAATPVSPVVQASAVDGGAVMQPFAGQAASGAAGMTTWTAIGTPGACPTWKYDGSEWVRQ